MRLKYNLQFQKIGKKYVGVAVGKDKDRFTELLQLNETMHAISVMLTDEVSREDIILQLLDAYDVERTELEKYVDEALDFYREKGLL